MKITNLLELRFIFLMTLLLLSFDVQSAKSKKSKDQICNDFFLAKKKTNVVNIEEDSANSPTLLSFFNNSRREHTSIRVDPTYGLFIGSAIPSHSSEGIWAQNKMTTVSGGQYSTDVTLHIPANNIGSNLLSNFANSNPNLLNRPTSQIGFQGSESRQSLQTVESNSISNMSEQSLALIKSYETLSRNLVAQSSSMTLSSEEMLRKYLNEVVNRSGTFSREVLEYGFSGLLSDDKYMETVRNHYSGKATAYRHVDLSNYGLDRYFYFIPKNETLPVAARVLDIGKAHNGNGYIILAEWISTNSEADGIRNRFVGQLFKEELESILAPRDRSEIAQVFIDTLSLDEVRTLQLSSSYRVKTFSFITSNSSIRDAGSAMDFFMHKVSLRDTIATFGKSKVLNLLSESERRTMYDGFFKRNEHVLPSVLNRIINNEFDYSEFNFAKFGFFEVMSRYLAKDILNLFDPNEFYFRYIFVITEDGQIKVSPYSLQDESIVKPEILRLAQGRRIFAGGNLYFEQDGNLKLKLDAHEYMYDRFSGRSTFLTSDNGDLYQFIVDSFAIQTGRRVIRIDDHENLEPSFEAQNFRMNIAEKPSLKPKKKKIKTWDIDDLESEPLLYEEWVKAFTPTSSNLKLGYAFYVLSVDSSTPLSDIKKNRKLLMARFHPDKTQNENDKKKYTLISQSVSEGYKLIEISMKTRL